MSINQDAYLNVQMITKLANSIHKFLQHIITLEKYARELMLDKRNPEKIAALNKQINQLMNEADHALMKAKIEAEAIQSFSNLNQAQNQELQSALTSLNKSSTQFDNLSKRILLRTNPPKTDPIFEILKAQKTPTLDPIIERKNKELVAKLFDPSSKVIRENSIPVVLNQFDNKDINGKRLFLRELAKQIISGSHPELDARDALKQISILQFKTERNLFINALKFENKELTFKILDALKAPTTPLPPIKKYSKDDMLYNISPESKPKELTEFQKRVNEAADGGIEKVKEMLNQIPEENRDERLQFIRAVREERDHRKLEALDKIKVPDEEPETPRSGPRF